MDTFLQLDASVYDDDLVDNPVDLETQIQHRIEETSPSETLFCDQLDRLVGVVEKETELEQVSILESNEQERQHYLQRILVIKKKMQKADKELQQRIDTMERILKLKDPKKQLIEYLALKQKDRQDDSVDIVEELLQCANRMINIDDNEVAAIGTFFFQCDQQRPITQGMTAMLPVVAAILEVSNGMDHTLC